MKHDNVTVLPVQQYRPRDLDADWPQLKDDQKPADYRAPFRAFAFVILAAVVFDALLIWGIFTTVASWDLQ